MKLVPGTHYARLFALLAVALIAGGCAPLPVEKLFVSPAHPVTEPPCMYVAVPESQRVYAIRIADDRVIQEFPVDGHPSVTGTREDAVVSTLTGPAAVAPDTSGLVAWNVTSWELR